MPHKKNSYMFIKNGAFLCFIEYDSNGLTVLNICIWSVCVCHFDDHNVSVFITTGDYVRGRGGRACSTARVVMFLSLSRLTPNRLPHNYGILKFYGLTRKPSNGMIFKRMSVLRYYYFSVY